MKQAASTTLASVIFATVCALPINSVNATKVVYSWNVSETLQLTESAIYSPSGGNGVSWTNNVLPTTVYHDLPFTFNPDHGSITDHGLKLDVDFDVDYLADVIFSYDNQNSGLAFLRYFNTSTINLFDATTGLGIIAEYPPPPIDPIRDVYYDGQPPSDQVNEYAYGNEVVDHSIPHFYTGGDYRIAFTQWAGIPSGDGTGVTVAAEVDYVSDFDVLVELTIEFTPSANLLAGDATMDGYVGVDDYNKVLANWNQSIEGWNNGDLNGDGYIGSDDLNIVLVNWGSGTPPIVTVPEPATALLGLSGATAILCLRRRLE